ncbi:MAG: permease-like cell division protein FtsX [Acutalibacteraceae bacterium]
MNVGSIGYLLREGIKNVWNNRIMSIASIGVLISCLVLTGTAALLSMNVAKVVESVGDSNVTTVYLDDNIDELKGTYIAKEINKLENVTKVQFYSKEEAILTYKEVLGEEVFKNMQGKNNPLPNAVNVTMDDLSKYDETVKSILKIEGVDSVNSRREVAQRLTSLNNLVSRLSILVIIALGVISLFIISNTIRMTMYSRRFEISIMKSVGATNAFVRIPFIIEGIVMGLISSILSTLALMFLYDMVMKAIEHLIPITPIPFTDVMWIVIASFAAAGTLIGALGGFISIRKYLKKEGNEILGW